MFDPVIINYSDKKAAHVHLTGTKAARLSYLLKNGFPVPEFFVISTRGTDYFFRNVKSKRTLRLKAYISDNLSKLYPENSDRGGVAVRSSAPIEDHEYFSFAGQFETFLNQAGIGQIWQSAYNCWKSMQKNHVPMYLKQMGIGTQSLRMAVIVQKMITAEWSGVLFTHNPVNNDANQILFEFVPGTGDALVGGSLTPQGMIVDKRTKRVIAGCEVKSYPDIARLAEMAISIEEIFRAPQDVEWAYAAGRFWILQSRPITKISSKSRVVSDPNSKLYTDYFFVERFLDPPSPLGWTVLKDDIEQRAFKEPLWYLGKDRLALEKCLTKIIKGRPHVQLKVFTDIYSSIPLLFISQDKKSSLLLGSYRKSWLISLLHSLPYLLTRLITNDANWMHFIHLRMWHRFATKCEKRLQVIHEINLNNYREDSIIGLFNELIFSNSLFLSYHRWSLTFADIFYELTLIYLKLLKFQTPKELLHDLLTGIVGNKTVEANLALQKMAVKQKEGSLEKQDLDKFFRKYGHRSESLDIHHPTWMENKKNILNYIAQLSRPQYNGNLKAGFKRTKRKRELAEKLCYDHINSTIRPLFRLLHNKIFTQFLLNAQGFAVLRENQRDLWHKILNELRKIVLHMAEELHARELIVEVDAVFFITKRELINLYGGTNKENIAQKVQKRKMIWQNVRQSYGSFHATDRSRLPKKRLAGLSTYQGIGVSAGIIKGSAHVAHTLTEAQKVTKDEILVIESVDPAWTPIFNMISGLVLEVGGVLSHSSILAREFGLPTITNVSAATKDIHTGDIIQIDGQTGYLEILSRVSH